MQPSASGPPNASPPSASFGSLVDHDAKGAGTHVLPHLAVTAPGNVDVVWYGTAATGEPNGVCVARGEQRAPAAQRYFAKASYLGA